MPLTAAGLERPTADQVLEQIASESRSTVSPGLDFGQTAPMGAIARIVARKVDAAYQVLESALNGVDRDVAEGVLLDALGKLTGTPRPAASYSEVTCSCTLTAGTKLVSGTHFARMALKPDVRATPKADFEAPSDGSFPIVFRAENAGAIEIPAGALSIIATAVNGWTDVGNAHDAVPGRVVALDPAYRVLQTAELGASGSAAPASEQAGILRLSGVLAVKVLENVGGEHDTNGLPPHSTEAIVWDGGTGATDNELAQAVWNHGKSGGIRMFGSNSGTAIDANGDPQTVNFTRATQRAVYLAYTVVAGADYAGDAAFEEKIAERANALCGIGVGVIAAALQALPFDPALELGIVDRTSFALDFTSSPVATSNLAIGVREIARFDSSRVAVTS